MDQHGALCSSVGDGFQELGVASAKATVGFPEREGELGDDY